MEALLLDLINTRVILTADGGTEGATPHSYVGAKMPMPNLMGTVGSWQPSVDFIHNCLLTGSSAVVEQGAHASYTLLCSATIAWHT